MQAAVFEAHKGALEVVVGLLLTATAPVRDLADRDERVEILGLVARLGRLPLRRNDAVEHAAEERCTRRRAGRDDG